MIRFVIPGIPQHQGNHRANMHGRMYETNKQLAPWRRDALACIRDAKGETDGPVFTGPASVTMIAYFPRPASHYGTGRNAGILKPGAPIWHSSAPDCDKVQRALGDALTQAGMILDDRLIVAWDASKVYGDPRMDVTVTDATEIPPDLVAVIAAANLAAWFIP